MSPDKLRKSRCPRCEQLFGVPERLFGKTTTCPSCETNLEIDLLGRVSLEEAPVDFANCRAIFPDPNVHSERKNIERALLAEHESQPGVTIEGCICDDVEIDQYTPNGNLRSKPIYSCTITNAFLNKKRSFSKTSVDELEQELQSQEEKWNAEELKERSMGAVESMNEILQTRLRKITSILSDGLDKTIEFNWNRIIDNAVFPPFSFRKYVKEAQPQKPNLPTEPREPIKTIFDVLIPVWYRRRCARFERKKRQWRSRVKSLSAEYREAYSNWQTREDRTRQLYKKERRIAAEKYRQQEREFLNEQRDYNDSVAHFRKCLAAGNPEAISEYLSVLFAGRAYPRGFFVDHDVSMDGASSTVVVDLRLPDLSDLWNLKEIRFVKTTSAIKEIVMKPKEHGALYDEGILQSVLRTAHEVFAATEQQNVQAAVINGWVTHLNQATGKEENQCTISVSIDREQFEQIDLRRVDPAACIKGLNGVVAGPLSEIVPVRPIMHLSRDDSRFVESREVLDGIESSTNLAEIGWEEFEHLVRELIGKIFSGEGVEVKVTQCSSDGGVDAVAFDPDPIRGGKYVVQAKRYSNTVPVSAVRDLYGAMQHEGAAKGILVTTSTFGRDSRKFVENKPITLIDGSNLVYLLEEHGYKVRIDIDAAKRNKDWNPLSR